MLSRVAFCWLFQTSFERLVASNARSTPGTAMLLGSWLIGSAAHRIADPATVPFDDTAMLAPLEYPDGIDSGLCEVGVELNRPPLRVNSLRLFPAAPMYRLLFHVTGEFMLWLDETW